jgi:4-hydroxy-2-oxoheptanedioate aldolase
MQERSRMRGRRIGSPVHAARVVVDDHVGEVGPQRTCCLLIETAEAVEHIEAILDVPGVDLAVVAQFDLSTALGVHGQFDLPVYDDAMVAIEQVAVAKGMPLDGVALTADQSASLIAKGYRVLLHGFAVLMLKSQVASFMTWS